MNKTLTIQSRLTAVLNDFIDWVSFDDEIGTIVDRLNQTYEEPIVKPILRRPSHPGGFRRELGKRRVSIAEAYIIIAKSQAPELYEARLDALRILVEQSLHAKNVTMPINTARMQIFMMKEAVNAYGNRRRQMEFVADFGRVSFGNEVVIRSFLKKNGLIEVPEEDKPLKQLGLGWDDHLHDSLSDGRKAPSQILIDAFIRGLSCITLVYNNIEESRIISEAITGGEIMGIAVEIGIEFSVGVGGERRHYMYVPPVFAKSKDFFAFLKDNDAQLADFREGLKKNVASRCQSIFSIIKQFNDIHLPRLNESFSPDGPCWFMPLKVEELDKIVACGQPSREHLAELLFARFKSVFYKRVLYFKTQTMSAESRFKRGIFSRWELDAIRARYHECRNIYSSLNRNDLAAKYLAPRSAVDYDSSFDEEAQVFGMLKGLPGKIVLINPLELGVKKAIKCVVDNIDYITNVETMNLRDCSARNPNDAIVFNKFVYNLNNRSLSEMQNFLEQHNITEINPKRVAYACKIAFEKPIIPNCGSDSTGRNSLIPGMGFIRSSKISNAIKKEVMAKHVTLPKPISSLILNKGKFTNDPQDNEEDDSETIVCLGTQQEPITNKVGDERKVEAISFERFWRYLNSNIKNLLRLTSGFAVALYWMALYQFERELAIGFLFATIWFVITFSRNVLVDLIASAGTDFKRWTMKNVNFDNAYQSLFWTGLSVPIMGLVKHYFDVFWTGKPDGVLFEGVKFFCLCLANGTYIALHNRLRDFDKKVIKVNFFRSILSWPVATLFAPFGNMVGIPSIVQAKFWSDVVAGFIEGGAKFSQRFTLRKRDLIELLPRLSSEDRTEVITAMLDILYIWGKAPRGKTCLRLLLLNKPSIGERIWKKKQSPEEVKLRTIRARNEYLRMLTLFRSEGMIHTLTDFALKNYSGRDSYELTNLIGTEAEAFLAWLKELDKQFDKDL
ncbi:MAG: hypothetical protein BWY02_01701 [bacterium ADurb.Bin157]|nr:MAG: hypothetical protein BWY02_01701 [bacterium ADurb.Bin157]